MHLTFHPPLPLNFSLNSYEIETISFFSADTSELSYVKFWHLLRLMNNNKIDKKEPKYTYKRIWCLRVTMRYSVTLCNVVTARTFQRLLCLLLYYYSSLYIVSFFFLFHLCATHPFNIKRVCNHAYELLMHVEYQRNKLPRM